MTLDDQPLLLHKQCQAALQGATGQFARQRFADVLDSATTVQPGNCLQDSVKIAL
jgi:hypothetical protein